jgi:hypothetical protein
MKFDHTGQEKVRYLAQRLPATHPTTAAVRAVWQTPTIHTATTTFATGDILHETFYTDRWYNVFALYVGETGRLKGWYCNVTRPTEITPTEICWTDLALDVWVDPDGRVTVLDEDEFWAIPMSADERAHCLQALAVIKHEAATGGLPR